MKGANMTMHDMVWKIANQTSQNMSSINYDAKYIKDCLEWIKDDIPINDDEKIARYFEVMMEKLDDMMLKSDIHKEIS